MGIDERGAAVEQALQSELEQVLQIGVLIGGGDAFEADGTGEPRLEQRPSSGIPQGCTRRLAA